MRLVLYIFFIGLTLNSFAQPKAKQIQHSKKGSQGDGTCFYQARYSQSQRLQFYPFNIADTIKLISFRYHHNKYPIKDGSIIADSIIESKTLSHLEVNVLTDILYNNFYRNPNGFGYINQCFFPRNAILFIDKEGKVKEYIAICFHCDNYAATSKKIDLGADCSYRIEKLRKFFIAKGLQFGTDKEIDLYSGESYKDD